MSSLPVILNRYATPLTTGLFLVSGVSGVALFFRWQTAFFHSAHEWLSMVLLLPFALHVWKNWASLVAYFRRGRLFLPVAAAIVAVIPFAWPAITGQNQGSPGARAVRLLTQAPITALAPVLKTTPDAIQKRLAERGYADVSPDSSLETVAATTNAQAAPLLLQLLPR